MARLNKALRKNQKTRIPYIDPSKSGKSSKMPILKKLLKKKVINT